MLACYSPSQDIISSRYQDINYFSPHHSTRRNLLSSSCKPPQQPHSQLMSIRPQQNPAIRVQQSSPFSAADQTAQQMLAQPQLAGSHWGGSSEHLLSPARFASGASLNQRNNTATHHKRTSSASSAGSIGPPSPRDATTVYPRIAGSDASHFSPSAFDSFDFFATSRAPQMPKSLPTPVDTPTQNNFNSSDYQNFSTPHDIQNSSVMRRIQQNRSPNNDDDVSYSYSAPQSVSSVSHHNSPATPQTASYDGDFGDTTKSLQNAGFNPQLGNMTTGVVPPNFDELYSNQLQHMAPQQQQQMMARAGGLSPFRASLANRFHAAQIDHVASRGSSPAHSIQRERSPFRQGSEFDQAAPIQTMSTMRGQGLAVPQLAQASYQQHPAMNNAAMMQAQHAQPQRQEQPKTVSPKDVELDYHEEDSTPLFPSSQQTQFSLPREESNFSTSSNFGQPGQYYTTVPMNANHGQQYPFAVQQSRQLNNMRSGQEQSLPDFPAHLSSMETTVSSEAADDTQTPMQAPRVSPIARPRDTSADVGAYSCTSHGCMQRFDSPVRLQRHRREAHGPTSPIASGTATSLSAQSPSNQGHVSSASTIASRNAQSGPHRCERISPTTGKPCNAIFSRPYDLTRHEDTIHSGRKHKVRCHLCTEEKTFSRNDALTRHMRVVHPEVDWPGKTTRRKGRE